MRRFTVLLAVLLSLAPRTVAPVDEMQDDFDTAMTQTDLHLAAGHHARTANAELARVRAELDRYLDDESRRDLETADRAFEAYRAAEAAFEAGQYRGGTMEPMVACLAYASLTHERAQNLAQQLADIAERNAAPR